MKIYNDVRHTILDVKIDKRTEVYNWGLDNKFPSLIETLINLSVTSSTCIQKVSKAVYGKSFGDIGKVIVNSDGQTLNEVLRIASREYSKHNNLFIHIGYNALLEIKSIKVIPCKSVRIGKQDDLGYSGKYIVADWEDRPKPEEFRIYDRYSPIQTVIQSQIEKAGSITSYKGQILHLQKDTNSIYSLPDLNPVMSEALLEHNSQLFRSNSSERGFTNTKLLTIKPFSSDDERRQFHNKLNELQGTKNSGSVLLMESTNVSDNLDNEIKLSDLTSEYNDELFAYSDSQAEKNICKAFGVPVVLVDSSNDGLFGNSGEMLLEAKKQLYESREEERDMIEEMFQKLLSNFHKPIEGELKIISPFQEQITSPEQTISE